MKFLKNKSLTAFFVAAFALAVSPLSYALSTDQQQPIYIDSDTQNLDLNDNTVIFAGDVRLTQGSIKINADKLVVVRPKGKEGQEVMIATGKPATFSQVLDDGKKIDGEAESLRYDVGKQFLEMERKAVLLQSGNRVEGQLITYNIKTQKLSAKSANKKDRVTTILQPNQTNN